ncbi:MAG: UPF0228 family protein [Methanosarcina sp.]
MNKISKKIAFFIVFLTLLIITGVFIKMTVDTKPPVNTSFPVPGSQVGGLYIQFKDGISESEVKTILQNSNMTVDYRMEYDTNSTDEIYYIMVDKNKITDVRDELGKENNWTKSVLAIKKGNYYIITVYKQATDDKNFLEVLDKYDLQLKRFVWCEIRFYKGSKNWWIPEKEAIKIKNELEQNENICTVMLSYLYP